MNKQTAIITAGVTAAALALGGTTIALASTTSPVRDDRSTSTISASATPSESPSAVASESGVTSPSSTPSSISTTTPTTDPTSSPSPAPSLGAAAKLELAKAAALRATGGGTVVSAHASGSSNHAYEVLVRLADGTVHEVKVAADFTVLRVEPQSAAKHHGTHSADDATDDHGEDATDDHGGDATDDHGGDHSGNGDDDSTHKSGDDDSTHDNNDDNDDNDDHGGHGHGSDD